MPRTVLVTGASSGLGRALALELARRGAHLALAARRKDELERVAADARALGAEAHVHVVDVGDAAAAMETVRRAEKDLGSLDMVIANAGVTLFHHPSTMAWDDVARVFDVNVKGAVATLMAAVPIMIAQQGGHLVGVSSLASRRGLPMSAAYCASKAALSTFLESLRLDLARANVRVTDVQPGFVETPMLEGATHPTPLAWTSEKAARVIATRLLSRRPPAVVAFPWPIDLLTSLARVIPARLFDPLARALSAAPAKR